MLLELFFLILCFGLINIHVNWINAIRYVHENLAIFSMALVIGMKPNVRFLLILVLLKVSIVPIIGCLLHLTSVVNFKLSSRLMIVKHYEWFGPNDCEKSSRLTIFLGLNTRFILGSNCSASWFSFRTKSSPHVIFSSLNKVQMIIIHVFLLIGLASYKLHLLALANPKNMQWNVDSFVSLKNFNCFIAIFIKFSWHVKFVSLLDWQVLIAGIVANTFVIVKDFFVVTIDAIPFVLTHLFVSQCLWLYYRL